MVRYIDLDGVERFLQNIIGASVVNESDYVLGILHGKIVRIPYEDVKLLNPYLEVTPEDYQYISESKSVEYNVSSNTDWKVN